MHLRYDEYFRGAKEIDHEKLLTEVPKKDKIYKTFEQFESDAFISTIKSISSREGFYFIKKGKESNLFTVQFLFNSSEVEQLQELNPTFVNCLYHFSDRLAEDENGELYDIDEQKGKNFEWWMYEFALDLDTDTDKTTSE